MSLRRDRGADQRVNGWLAVALLVILVLVALPVGSNRPPFIAAASLTVALVGLWYWLRLARIGQSLRVKPGDIALPALLFAALLAFLAYQLLPLGEVIRSVRGEAVVSSAVSLAPGATALLIVQLLGYGFFAFLMLQVSARRARAVAMLDWVFGGLVAYAGLSLFMFLQMGDTYFGIPKEYYQGSLTGTFVNRNSVATFLAFGLAGGCAMLTEAWGGTSRRLSLRPVAVLAGLILIGIALLATNSRMGAFAGALGAVTALVAGAVKARFAWWKWGLMLLVLAGGLVWLVPQFAAGLLNRLFDLEFSAEQRFELYRQVGVMIGSSPWTGWGGGAFEWVFPLFHQATLSTEFVWDRAHSTYLALWAELGLFAGTVPLIIIAIFAGRAAGSFLGTGEGWSINLAAVAVTIVAAVHSLVDFSLEIPANAYLFLALLAIGAAGQREAVAVQAGPGRLLRERMKADRKA